MKRIVALVLVIATVSVPFFAMASKWGSTHNWCSAGKLEQWLITHPGQDWHTNYQHDYYDYKSISSTKHSYKDETSGQCVICGARVTCRIETKTANHAFTNKGAKILTKAVRINGSQHVAYYRQTVKCVCGETKTLTWSETQSHSFKNGKCTVCKGTR